MKSKLLQWLGLDTWMRGIERAVGETRILAQERIRSLEEETLSLREENRMLLEAFIALKIDPPAPIEASRRVPAARVVQALTAQAFARDRENS